MRKLWLLVVSAVLLGLAVWSGSIFSSTIKPAAISSGESAGAWLASTRRIASRDVSRRDLVAVKADALDAAAAPANVSDAAVFVRRLSRAASGHDKEIQSGAPQRAIPPPAQVMAPTAPALRPAPPERKMVQPAATVSALDAFAVTVRTGAHELAGLYSPSGLQLRVDQQGGDPLHVNTNWGWASQFGLAAQYGSLGLLAHNFLSGAAFADVGIGQELDAVFGDGTVRRYSVNTIRRFQALRPTDPYSDMLDLATGLRLSSTDTFMQVYKGDRLVLQTCITENGDPIWGRLFVIAGPL
jgi:hypothetical protein